MNSPLVSAVALVAITMVVHAIGLALVLRSLRTSWCRPCNRLLPTIWLLIKVTWALLGIHLIEIAVWGLFFVWQGCMPDAETSFYFAGVTYTTVGYGDVVLPTEWRMLGPVAGLTGILMCGLSTGFFFAVLNRVFGASFDQDAARG